MIYFDENYNVHLYSRFMTMPKHCMSNLSHEILKTSIYNYNKILGLGCGNGVLDTYIINMAQSMYLGVDNSSLMLSSFSKNDEKVNLVKTDIYKWLQIPNEKNFSICLCFGIFPFLIDNLLYIFERLYKLLLPNSILIMSIDVGDYKLFESPPINTSISSELHKVRNEFFCNFHRIRKQHGLNIRKEFFSNSFWIKKFEILEKTNLFSHINTIDYYWENKSISFESILRTFWGKEKVFQFCYDLPQNIRDTSFNNELINYKSILKTKL